MKHVQSGSQPAAGQSVGTVRVCTCWLLLSVFGHPRISISANIVSGVLFFHLARVVLRNTGVGVPRIWLEIANCFAVLLIPLMGQS